MGSLKQTNAVQDVSEGSFVALVVHVELAVACAHFDFILCLLIHFVDVAPQRTTAAQVWHVA